MTIYIGIELHKKEELLRNKYTNILLSTVLVE